MKRVVMAISFVTISLMAGDYSKMTTDELSSLRGSVPVENREAFRAEMQSRMQAMTPQERAEYRANSRGKGHKAGLGMGKKNQGANKSEGMHQRLRDGSGSGRMHKGVDRIKKQQKQEKKQKLKD